MFFQYLDTTHVGRQDFGCNDTAAAVEGSGVRNETSFNGDGIAISTAVNEIAHVNGKG
jgi:hypothetical protein